MHKLEQEFQEHCLHTLCDNCKYSTDATTNCIVLFAYDKGRADAIREQDQKTDLQRWRVSGHP